MENLVQFKSGKFRFCEISPPVELYDHTRLHKNISATGIMVHTLSMTFPELPTQPNLSAFSFSDKLHRMLKSNNDKMPQQESKSHRSQSKVPLLQYQLVQILSIVSQINHHISCLYFIAFTSFIILLLFFFLI